MKRTEDEINKIRAKLASVGHSAEVQKSDCYRVGLHRNNLNVFERRLKINGLIGNSGNNDKLSSSRLIHQIHVAMFKGYNEDEVVDAVV